MDGIIRLLPDLVANQIAAGEVIQRPASAVKELLENAVDAKATTIELWINDAGKKLIMVVDNGKGMSPADCRLCFERFATSKIERSDDLFKIRTLGFRGEALASIAAVAQTELKSRRPEDELATIVKIDGGKFQGQEPATHSAGTTVSVKNLFYNVPARRNFLKGNNIELKHIIEEFSRVVLANEHISFKFFNEGKELYHLPASNLKQRIVNLFGSHYNSRFVPVLQETDIVNISGFTGKPEFAKKVRGEQYFFVNGRYFRHSYLHHAVLKAYQNLISESNFPSWFIFLTIDPSQVDVNIHPTKTEVNFIENQSIYAILHTAVKSALGKHNLTPSLDFEMDPVFNPHFPAGMEIKVPTISSNPNYNPFENQSPARPEDANRGLYHQGQQTSLLNQRNWDKLFRPTSMQGFDDDTGSAPTTEPDLPKPHIAGAEQKFLQVHNTYIVTSIKSGLMVVHQQLAHQRILFHQYIQELSKQEGSSQQLLFPVSMSLTPEEHVMLDEIGQRLIMMGFQWEEAEGSEIVVTATPAGMNPEEVAEAIESIMHEWNESSGNDDAVERYAIFLAKRRSIKTGNHLTNTEMEAIINQLFSTDSPYYAPGGQKTCYFLSFDELHKLLNV
jgi:DNA mismatch repair protein MutL